eukprot:scaffold190_cov171-Amphora_coffeaeformis.AAC.42
MKARACIGLFVSWSLSQFPSSFADDAPISPAAENATMIPIETPSPSEWLLGINSTETVCVSNIFGGLTCNTETRVTAPDGEYSDMAISVDCANKDTTDFRSNHSKCTCSVVLLDDQGRIKSGCSCDICPFGYGRSPVIVDCQEDFIVAQCTSIDCDHGCNGACESDCTLSGSECTLPCQDSQFTSTTAPTSLFLDTNETFIQTVPPSIMSNETLSPTTVDNETETLAPTTSLDFNETDVPTLAPSVTEGTVLGDNETETLAPTEVLNTTLLDTNETNRFAPTVPPTSINGTLLGNNGTDTLIPTPSPNMTFPGANETETFEPKIPPTGINGTLRGDNETETLSPFPNVTLPDTNETEILPPTAPPTGINVNSPGDNETETLVPSTIPNSTLPDTNETESNVPTLAPTIINGTDNETGTSIPTEAPNMTLPDTNEIETSAPTISPNATLPDTNQTGAPTVSPNATLPDANETETNAPTVLPNATLPDANETETSAPTVLPNATLPNANETETHLPTVPPNATLPNANETETNAPTVSPNMTLPDANETKTNAPTVSPNATLPDANQTETNAPTVSPNATLPNANETEANAPTVPPNATLPDANQTETSAPTVPPNATLPNANETETNAPTVSPNATLPDTNGLETNAPTVAPNSTFLDSEDGNTTMPTMAPTGALIPESDDDDTAAPSIAPNVSLPGTPTLSPSVSDAAETMAPVALPSTVPTPLPSTPPTTTPAVETKSEVQVYEFTGISMRLTGVGLTPLTAETKTVFEAVTEDFYRNAYRSARARRRLQFVESFDTDVTVIRDRVDSTGNTITYDQTLSFTAEMGSLDEIFAADILLVPLSGKELQQIYLQALKTGNEAFGGVTAVTTPSLPEPNFTVEEDSGEIDMLLLIFITIGGVLLFGACFVAIVLVRRCSGDGGDPIRDGDKKGEQDKYLEDEYMYGNPNDRISQLNDPFIDEIGRAPEKRDRSDRSADDFFLDPSENVGGDEDGRGEVFNDETESGRHRGREDRSFGLGGISRRHQGRTEDDSSNGSDTDSRSGSSSGLGSTDHYGDSGSESGSGSYSGSDSSSSEDGTNFQ